MALNFPISPSVDDLYTYGGKTWKYNGTGWQLIQSTSALDAVNSNLNNEISQRQAADLSINNAISVVSAAVQNEISARLAADTSLSARINSVNANPAASVASADFHSVSAVLENHINTISNALSVETAARTNAVYTLSNNLSAEIVNRTAEVNAASAAAQSAINTISNSLSIEKIGRAHV